MHRRTPDLLAAAAFLAGVVVMAREAFSDVYRSTGVGVAQDAVFYPKIVLAVIALLAIVLAVRALRGRAPGPDADAMGAVDAEPPLRWRPVLATAAAATSYAVLLHGVGYLASTVLFVAATPVLLGFRRWWLLALTVLLFPLGSWWLFVHVIGIPLPTGSWIARA